MVAHAGLARADDADTDACPQREPACSETSAGDKLIVTCTGARAFVIALRQSGEWREQPMAALDHCAAAASFARVDYSVEVVNGEVRTPVTVDRSEPPLMMIAPVPVAPPAGPTCSTSGVYGEPSLMSDGHGTFLRHGLGAILRDCVPGKRGRAFRAGMAFDLSDRYQSVGVETEVTFPIWKLDLGVRAEIGAANNSQAIYSLGERVRLAPVFVAVDSIAAHQADATGRTIVVGVGASGRPAKYILATEAAIVVLGLVLVAAVHPAN